MEKVQSFHITYQKSDITAGQELIGHVVLVLDQPMMVRSINLNVLGVATIRWPTAAEGRNSKISTSSKISTTPARQPSKSTLNKFESHINVDIKVRAEDEQKVIVPAGLNAYPFSVKIPETCPTSYEDENCSIKYTTKATVHFTEIIFLSCVQTFYVIGITQLPENVNQSVHKKCGNGYGLCFSGEVLCTVHVPKCVYTQNDYLPITIGVRNNSKDVIEKVTVELVKKISYRFQRKRNGCSCNGQVIKTKVSIVDEVTEGPIKEKQSNKPSEICMYLKPTLSPTITCSLMCLEYLLQFKIKKSSKKISSPKFVCPIFIKSAPTLAITERQEKLNREHVSSEISSEHSAFDIISKVSVCEMVKM